MFKRKAYEQLLTWKNKSHGRSAILIEGARRVGKSTLVEQFAKREYAAHLIIDFAAAPNDVKNLFTAYRHDVNQFFKLLFAFYRTTPKERDTLIVFDEVQRLPEAREFIKQLVADGRYDYAETGSLISIRQNVESILIPSEEDAIQLTPFDFEEFLWAMNDAALADLIRESFDTKRPLPQALHRRCENRFREYLLVGGMPQAIAEYANTNNFQDTDAIKRRILRLYEEDIQKFSYGDAAKVAAIFDAIPGQLSKHEKKFTMSALGENARYRSYDGAFFWLADARMTNMCQSSTDPSVGLGLNAEQNSFKCYFCDTGLLTTRALQTGIATEDKVYRDILFGKLQINEGMLTENAVAQQLAASGKKLYFYSRYSKQTPADNMEVDFLAARPYKNAGGKMRICPIEVKSTKRYRTTSLDRFKAKFGKRIGEQIILHPKELCAEGDRLHLPLYMAHLL